MCVFFCVKCRFENEKKRRIYGKRKNKPDYKGMGIIICNALRNGHTPEQISDFNGISLEEVLAVQLLINQGKL